MTTWETICSRLVEGVPNVYTPDEFGQAEAL